jgi:hypothetical protein
MTDSKKTRNMSIKGWLHKASGKVSATAFLASHREWLLSGDLSPVTSPILVKLDSKEILPTVALTDLRSVLLGHMVAKEAAKAEDDLLNPKGIAGRRDGTRKPWVATIYNAKGEIQTRVKEDGSIEDLQKGFDKSSDADRWVDRRLFDGAPDWFGTVSHTTLCNKEGDPISTVIMRDDAIARILRQPKDAVMKVKSKTTDKLSFGVKVHNDHSTFSGG